MKTITGNFSFSSISVYKNRKSSEFEWNESIYSYLMACKHLEIDNLRFPSIHRQKVLAFEGISIQTLVCPTYRSMDASLLEPFIEIARIDLIFLAQAKIIISGFTLKRRLFTGGSAYGIPLKAK